MDISLHKKFMKKELIRMLRSSSAVRKLYKNVICYIRMDFTGAINFYHCRLFLEMVATRVGDI